MDDWIQVVSIVMGIIGWPLGLVVSIAIQSLLPRKSTPKILEPTCFRSITQSLMKLDSKPVAGHWNWPAPESFALLCGEDNTRKDAFKIGLLHLIAIKVFIPEYIKASNPRRAWDIVLQRGTTAAGNLKGSLVAIYHLWENTPDPKTIDRVKQQAIQEYGSLTGFADREIKLVDLCTSKGDLESRVARALHQLGQNRERWVKRKPREALIASVVSIASGTQISKRDIQIRTDMVEDPGGPVEVLDENIITNDIAAAWLDWFISDKVQQAFAIVDGESHSSSFINSDIANGGEGSVDAESDGGIEVDLGGF